VLGDVPDHARAMKDSPRLAGGTVAMQRS